MALSGHDIQRIAQAHNQGKITFTLVNNIAQFSVPTRDDVGDPGAPHVVQLLPLAAYQDILAKINAERTALQYLINNYPQP